MPGGTAQINGTVADWLRSDPPWNRQICGIADPLSAPNRQVAGDLTPGGRPVLGEPSAVVPIQDTRRSGRSRT